MSVDPWESLLQQGQEQDPWEAALQAGLPQVGVTLEGIDADREAAAMRALDAGFAPWSQPGDAGSPMATMPTPAAWSQHSTVPMLGGSQTAEDQGLESLADFGQHGAMAATAGYGDELAGLAFGDDTRDAIRGRQQFATQRSPTASMVGDVAGGAALAVPTASIGGGLPFLGRVAAQGALGGGEAALTASGYADQGDRGEAALDALPEGAMWGAGGELAASAIRPAGQWIGDTVSPWLRDQGLLNRAASTGRPMQQLTKEFGGRQGLLDAGQFMEDNGMTSWSPQKLQPDLDDFTSMRQGDQRSFLDELGENPDAAPVDTNRVGQDLIASGYDQGGMAAQNAQQQAGQYTAAGDRLIGATPQGGMPFEDAWRQRQAFDQGARWNQGPTGDQGLAAVNRDAASGLRGAMGDALDATPMPEGSGAARPRWDAIQGDLSNSIGLSGGGDASLARELGSAPAPMSLKSAAGAMGGGLPGYGAAVVAQSGGRGMMADAFGGMSRGLSGVDGSVAGGMASMGGQMGAQSNARMEGVQEKSRGYLLPQAAMQLMQQEPQALGQYASQFFEAWKDPDSNALSNLITRLSHTDQRFKQTVLPRLQQLTASEY